MNRLRRKTVSKLGESTGSALLRTAVPSLYDLGRLLDAPRLLFSGPCHSDYLSYSKILQLCIDKRAGKEGRLIHSQILTGGLNSNLYLNTKLIIFYARMGDMVNARNVFNGMPEKSVVSWTALLSGYSQNGNSREALMVFSSMHRMGVKANQFTYGSVLRACTSMMSLDTGKQIQGCILKGRFLENLFVQSALVDMHSKCGTMEDACYVFQSMLDKDIVSWNAMIGGYAIQGFSDCAFQMFRAMLREGMMPDSFTLGSVLKAFSGGSCLMIVGQIHAFLIHLGFGSDNVLNGSMIDAYAKCGNLRSAKCVYKSMLSKDTISCTALITGYAREGVCSRDALSIFSELHQRHLGIDNVILCSMLNICANIASLGLGRQLHGLALKYQPGHDTALSNALIDMYSKSGEIDDANHIFEEMEDKNIISWTTLIAGYGKHGCGQKAIALYKKMEYKGLKPNDITFLSVLFACSHTGLTSEGWECFSRMVNKYDILPRVEHYSCVVDLFARGGLLTEAYDLICKTNLKPNASLWGSILGACSKYGNMSLGEVAARHLFNLDPANSVNYVVLASMYAAGGLWDNAWKTRKLMELKRLTKNPGCSLFQSTNKSRALLQPA